MLTRVDSQYRSHRSTVHARPVRASLVWANHWSRARWAAACDGYPPRRVRSARPNTLRAEQAKYHEPWSRWPSRGHYLAPQPAQPLRALTAAVTETWPQTPPYGGMFDEVVPHLTVATQVEPQVADRIEQQLAPA